jgi:hypothetical protein
MNIQRNEMRMKIYMYNIFFMVMELGNGISQFETEFEKRILESD